MGELIGASLLAVLAVYIVWDSLSTGRRGYRAGDVPGQAAADLALLVAAAVFAVMGAVVAVQPSHPPFIGRGAFLWSALYGVLGIVGMPLAFWVLALALVGVWFARRRQSQGRRDNLRKGTRNENV